jgi:hypothetical protein
MKGTKTPLSGVKHFRRISELGVGAYQSQEFTPTNPFFAELPKQVFAGQKLRIGFAGAKGLNYAVAYYKIDDAVWNSSKQISIIGAARLIQIGGFLGQASIQSFAMDMDIPSDLAPGNYIYLIATSVNNGSSWAIMDLTKVPQIVSQRLPVFEVLPQEQSTPANQLAAPLNFEGRGWGLSSD